MKFSEYDLSEEMNFPIFWNTDDFLVKTDYPELEEIILSENTLIKSGLSSGASKEGFQLLFLFTFSSFIFIFFNRNFPDDIHFFEKFFLSLNGSIGLGMFIFLTCSTAEIFNQCRILYNKSEITPIWPFVFLFDFIIITELAYRTLGVN